MGFIGLLLIGVLLYLVMKNRKEDFSHGVESPLELLQKRYANGEIDKEEYLEKKKVLS